MSALVCTLFFYHSRLITTNLTTNEEVNMSRYHYLKNAYLQYNNPFCKGSRLANLIDGLFPSTKSYYNREDVLKDRDSGSDGSQNEEGYFENDKAKLIS